MITACFDGAGKLEDNKTPMIVVAGFCSMARVWVDFESEWLKALNEFRIPYFHPGDFAHFKDPFRTFKDDETRRRDLVAKLLHVIESNGLRKFGAFNLDQVKCALIKLTLIASAFFIVSPCLRCVYIPANPIFVF